VLLKASDVTLLEENKFGSHNTGFEDEIKLKLVLRIKFCL